ncbi:dihydrolipoyllysine-residue acetyltransferase [Derxia gummosa]|uniref:Acetyltransferase component of pyruvate dehydrogenase complex n=1 Tax=Derxia gummosa DSM 723 TaxID=1121388 RepID=A0A8B6X5X1_9BURK|nr:dihydrolipoyllysine-residue acetyltransferase [Derxia gummosa]
MSLVEVKIPDIGDSKDVEVIEVLVKVGDVVKVEQSLITLESDKASMEVPSSAAGVVKEVKIKLGDKANTGDLVLLLEAEGAAAAAPAPAASAPAPAAPVASAPAPSAPEGSDAPTGVGGIVEVRVPDIGDSKDVELIEVLVKVGDTIKVEQSLITLESDKASMEVPSSAAGVLKELKVKLGDKLNSGDLIGLVEVAGGAAAPASAASAAAPAAAPAQAPAVVTAPPPASAARPAPPTAPEVEVPLAQRPHASPSVRKFARELGVDLSGVTGSGSKGRITTEDVQAYVKGVIAAAKAAPAAAPAAAGKSLGGGLDLLPWPKIDFSKFGETKVEPLSRIKKLSGQNLARNWVMIPHVTQFDEADVTELEQFRKDTNEALAKQGVKVTMLAFVMKACVAALKKFPAFNSSLDETGANLILKQYYHLGFAADTPNGLVVPVLRDVDKKGVAQLAKETAELAAKARDGKLSGADMQGASFTISSLGGVGGTAFTPIINAPEVAILGLSKTEIKPKWDGKAFQPKLMLPLSLSYDHRVIDGAQAARFTTYLSDVLADMRRVLI